MVVQNSSDGTGGWSVGRNKIATPSSFHTQDPSLFNKNYLKSAFRKPEPDVPNDTSSLIPPPNNECDIWGHHTAKISGLHGGDPHQYNKSYLKGDPKKQFESPAPSDKKLPSELSSDNYPQTDSANRLKQLAEQAVFLAQNSPQDVARQMYSSMYQGIMQMYNVLASRPLNMEEQQRVDRYEQNINDALSQIPAPAVNVPAPPAVNIPAPAVNIPAPPLLPVPTPPATPLLPVPTPPASPLIPVPALQPIVQDQLIRAKDDSLNTPKPEQKDSPWRNRPDLKHLKTVDIMHDKIYSEFVHPNEYGRNSDQIMAYLKEIRHEGVVNSDTGQLIAFKTAHNYLRGSRQFHHYMVDIRNGRIVQKSRIDTEVLPQIKTLQAAIRASNAVNKKKKLLAKKKTKK